MFEQEKGSGWSLVDSPALCHWAWRRSSTPSFRRSAPTFVGRHLQVRHPCTLFFNVSPGFLISELFGTYSPLDYLRGYANWPHHSTVQLTNGTQILVADAVFSFEAGTASNPVAVFTLNASDVLATPTDASGKHTVHVNGDSNDTLNLSNLLGTGAAPGAWAASGAVQENGQTFNSYTYSADPTLQVLVDNHLQHVTLS